MDKKRVRGMNKPLEICPRCKFYAILTPRGVCIACFTQEVLEMEHEKNV